MREELAERGQGKRAQAGKANLAAVGVAGEDEANVLAAGVGGDGGRVVRLVRHKQDGGVGVRWDGQVEVRVAERDVVDAGEEDVGVAMVDADVLIDE